MWLRAHAMAMDLTEMNSIGRLYRQEQYGTQYMRLGQIHKKEKEGGRRRKENNKETQLLEYHSGDKLPYGSTLLKDLCKSVERRKSQNRRNHERIFIPFDSEVGLVAILHALVVWNISPGANDGELSSPGDLRDSKYRSVDVGLGIPVTRDQKHVSTNVNPRFMDAEGRSGPGVVALHVDTAEVRGRFVEWDVHAETDNPSTSPQWPEVVALYEDSGLVLRVSLPTVKRKCLRDIRCDPVAGSVPLASGQIERRVLWMRWAERQRTNEPLCIGFGPSRGTA